MGLGVLAWSYIDAIYLDHATPSSPGLEGGASGSGGTVPDIQLHPAPIDPNWGGKSVADTIVAPFTAVRNTASNWLNPLKWFPSDDQARALFFRNQTTHHYNPAYFPFTMDNPYDSWWHKLKLGLFGESSAANAKRLASASAIRDTLTVGITDKSGATSGYIATHLGVPPQTPLLSPLAGFLPALPPAETLPAQFLENSWADKGKMPELAINPDVSIRSTPSPDSPMAELGAPNWADKGKMPEVPQTPAHPPAPTIVSSILATSQTVSSAPEVASNIPSPSLTSSSSEAASSTSSEAVSSSSSSSEGSPAPAAVASQIPIPSPDSSVDVLELRVKLLKVPTTPNTLGLELPDLKKD